MSDEPKEPVDETGFLRIGWALPDRRLTRINPDRPTIQAALHLRFWSQFSDKQIRQVLGKTPQEIEEIHHS